MLEDSETNPSSASNSSVEGDDSLVTNNKESFEKNIKDSIPEELKNYRKDSFKPLNFPTEGNSAFNSGILDESKSGKTDLEKINLAEGFKNSEFFYENSLLTNAEDFARSIREGANLYKSELLSKIEKKATDTERILEQTVSENKEAKKQREELLSSAKEKVEEIKKNAFQEGYDEGYKIGIEKRYDEAEPLVSNVNYFLDQLDSLREVIRFRAEKELVKLSTSIAKNIIAEEIKINDSVVEGIVRAALQETETNGKIYLYLNTEDYEFLEKCKSDLEKYLNEEQNLIIRKNNELKSGDIFVESDGEVISRSIESQFEKIEDTLNEQIRKNESSFVEGKNIISDEDKNIELQSDNVLQMDNSGEEGSLDLDSQNNKLVGNIHDEKIDFKESSLPDEVESDFSQTQNENQELLNENSVKINLEEIAKNDKQLEFEESEDNLIEEKFSEEDENKSEDESNEK